MTAFEHPIHPQFYDFDMVGVVHNVVYIRWLEDARTAFLRLSDWPMERLMASDLSPALTHTEIDYKKAIRPAQAVLLRAHVLSFGKSAWELGFTFVHPETSAVYASARQRGCFVRPSAMRPAPMPAEFAAFFAQYLAPRV